MNIENKEYYHVHRLQDNPHASQWSVGNKICIGGEENLFNAHYISYFVNPQIAPVILEGSLYVQNVLEQLKNVVNEYSLYVREEIFEEVRKTEFPHSYQVEKRVYG